MIYPVDVVITWVDGNDPVHIKKRNSRLAEVGNIATTAYDATRFVQCGELELCVRSWLCYAPWIRTIYIVTDAQQPPVLQKLPNVVDAGRIRVIDHSVIFKGIESALPTFNSISIESMLWQIPGLSEHFIYCNDDCFLLRPVKYTDFFLGSKLVVRGQWKLQHHIKYFNFKAPTFHRIIQENSAKLVGFQRNFLRLPHAPFALHKSIFMQSAELCKHNAMSAFRDTAQYWPIYWAQHLVIKNQTGILNNHLKSVMLHGEMHSWLRMQRKLLRVKYDPHVAFVCIQSLEQTSLKLRNKLMLYFLSGTTLLN